MTAVAATPMRRIRIFAASPSDVQNERDQLAAVVGELNQTLTTLVPEAGLVLELIRWETHVHPGLGTDPQDVVNRQIQIGEMDVFVAIFWLRLGTPTPRAESGTEEEFRIAYRAWKELGRAIQLMVYFCRTAAPPPRDSEAVEQLSSVVRLREALSKEGLARDFGEHSEFAGHVRRDLVLLLGQILHGGATPASIASKAAQVSTADDLVATRAEIDALADGYDAVRRPITGMRSGPERTRRMEVIASRMRALALSAFPLLDELRESASAGKRLAAVSILEAIPDVRHLGWLADRVRDEKPFVGYHAALGLLAAARSLDVDDLTHVQEALEAARRSTQHLRPDTDRETMLRYTNEELLRRMGTTDPPRPAPTPQ
jgi:hypothetical protein